ncbi:hypothetical protein [Metabacillus litoralis]|uniref:hypothetical protein n=1 Tax=Metabacillus litoralis TaxID=152268 RepID=UPI001CFE2AB7|nr:hypothetical protein [Metabacillus litoralis]
MKINTYLIQLAIVIIIIFGGTFTFIYLRSSAILLDQLIGASVGVILLIASLIWRKTNKSTG